MIKSLVTGGAGFIGSHLVDYLISLGHEVTIVDNLSQGNKLSDFGRKHSKLIIGDIKDFDTIDNACKGCDYIYHLAALLGVDVVAKNHVETMKVESIGTSNIIDAAIKYSVKKLIYASTSGVYGKAAFDKSVDENFMLDPRTSYSIAKRYNEIFLKSHWEENGLSSIAIRYFNVYGPRQDERMVVPRFINQGLNNEPIVIYGQGKQTRDFTYVTDAVRITVDLAETLQDGFEIFNICGDNELTITQVAENVKQTLKSKSKIQNMDMPNDRVEFEVERRTGNSNKLTEAIGRQEFIKFKNGLENIISGNKR